MTKQEIIGEIARKHHIILDENDPIIAVISANEMIMEQYLASIDKLFTKHKTDLESYKVATIREVKNYIEESKEMLQAIRSQQDSIYVAPQETTRDTQIKEAPKESIGFNKNMVAAIIASQVAFLLTGLIIGILI